MAWAFGIIRPDSDDWPLLKSSSSAVVLGGTPAGVAAAIQTARMGRNTVLLSFNRHVGGMTSGGLTSTDVGRKESIGGLAHEFYTRIGRFRDFRPSEAESLFLKMLDEAGVTILFERCLESVEIKDNQIISATMETGETFKAAMFIDTTYEGDLLAGANVSYRVGREPSAAYGESLAGQWQPISWKNTYQFCRLPLSPYQEPGNPESGLLPEISAESSGTREVSLRTMSGETIAGLTECMKKDHFHYSHHPAAAHPPRLEVKRATFTVWHATNSLTCGEWRAQSQQRMRRL